MLAGKTPCLGEVRAGWWVAGLEGGPSPGCPLAPGQGQVPKLFRLDLARDPGSEVSLAGCHHSEYLLHPWPRLPPLGSDSAGWLAQARTPGLSSLLSTLPHWPGLWSSPWPSSLSTLDSFSSKLGSC